MSLRNLVRSAVRGVMANKLRAVLTMLGIVIGVGSVIAMLALGNGARASVDGNFRSLGSDEIQIDEKMAMENNRLVPAGEILTYEDGLNLPAAVSQVDRVDIVVAGAGHVRYSHNVVDLIFLGTTADELRSLSSDGDFLPDNWPPGQPIHPQ